MNIDTINSFNETEKLIANKIDMVIKYKNRKTIFILGNYFKRLHIEFDFFTKFTLLPDLPTNIGLLYDSIHEIHRAASDYDYFIANGNSKKEALRKSISSCMNVKQKLYFLIHYPDITVTNENGKHTNIEDLYGLAEIENNAMLSLYGLVSTYSYEKASVGYAFSHLPHIDWTVRNGEPVVFRACCLGDGPIFTLKNAMVRERGIDGYVKDHHILMLAMNIDRYFHVESISGGPYIQMSRIGTNIDGFNLVPFIAYHNVDNGDFINSDIFKHMVRDTLIRMANDSKFFIDTTYSVRKQGNDVITKFGFPGFVKNIDEHGFCICFSEYFKKVYAEYSLLYDNLPTTDELIRCGVLHKYFESNGKLYERNNSLRHVDLSRFQGKFLFKFKGRDVNIHIGKPLNLNNRERIYISPGLSNVIHMYYRNTLCCSTSFNLFNKNSVV